MATATLKVTGMTCDHCVRAVTNALKGSAGVREAQVDLKAGHAVVDFDEATTTPRELGLYLLQTMPQPLRLHLFIGHTHWDHIQGFPFFAPAYSPSARIKLYSLRGAEKEIEFPVLGRCETCDGSGAKSGTSP